MPLALFLMCLSDRQIRKKLLRLLLLVLLIFISELIDVHLPVPKLQTRQFGKLTLPVDFNTAVCRFKRDNSSSVQTSYVDGQN